MPERAVRLLVACPRAPHTPAEHVRTNALAAYSAAIALVKDVVDALEKARFVRVCAHVL